MIKSNQEPIISTSINTLLPPALTYALPPERARAFQTSVANHLRAAHAKAQPEAAVIAQLVAEQVALAKALTTHDFVHAAASVYISEMAAQHATITMEEAHREIESIFKNRVADCKEFVKLLAQPEFITAVRAEAAQPAAVPQPYRLTPKKIEETVERLVQSTNKDGAEPAVHVAASARGHQVAHQALAAMFRPSASLRAPLVHALALAWPQASATQIEHLAEGWLLARHNPAHEIAKGLLPGGAIYQEAMRRADILQAQKLGEMPVAVISKPNAAIAGPAIHQGIVQNVADLALEV